MNYDYDIQGIFEAENDGSDAKTHYAFYTIRSVFI